MKRIALVVPINRRGQVLLQHRDSGAPTLPDHWAFFGGHLEQDENPEDAAKREFKEELQLELDILIFFKSVILDNTKWGKAERFFYLTVLDLEAEYLRRLQLEGDDLGWFDKEQLDDLAILEEDRMILNEIMNIGFFR